MELLQLIIRRKRVWHVLNSREFKSLIWDKSTHIKSISSSLCVILLLFSSTIQLNYSNAWTHKHNPSTVVKSCGWNQRVRPSYPQLFTVHRCLHYVSYNDQINWFYWSLNTVCDGISDIWQLENKFIVCLLICTETCQDWPCVISGYI